MKKLFSWASAFPYGIGRPTLVCVASDGEAVFALARDRRAARGPDGGLVADGGDEFEPRSERQRAGGQEDERERRGAERGER